MSELNSMRKRIKDLKAANGNLTVQLQEEQNLHKNEMPKAVKRMEIQLVRVIESLSTIAF